MLEVTGLLDLRPLLDHLVVDRYGHQLAASILLEPNWHLFAFDKWRVRLRLVGVSVNIENGCL